MRLVNLKFSGLRCYENEIDVPMHSLTVFIGENDSGKSSIVRAVQLLLTNMSIGVIDFHQKEDGTTSDRIEISGVFLVESGDTVQDLSVLEDGVQLIKLKKEYRAGTARPITQVFKETYQDERLNNFLGLSAEEIKTLVRDLGGVPRKLKADNADAVAEILRVGNLPKIHNWTTVSFSDVEGILPLYEPVLSTDYKDPGATIQSAVQSSILNKIRSINDADHPMYSTIRSFEEWVASEVGSEALSIPDFLRQTLPNIRSIKLNPKVDFSRIVSLSSVQIDMGRGHQSIDSYGEGTRKKLWMSLMEWNQSSHDETQLARSIVRVYDEPDLNLDYAAEKRLFDYISRSSRLEGSKIQNILCTHSVTLVDRAPAEAINLIRVSDDDTRTISFLRSRNNSDIEGRIRSFFTDIGSQLQIRNTELFYEKAFIVFEGETEQELIPVLYQKMFGRSVIEDGIVLINMHTCSNWRATLEFLGSNRMDRTVMILDKDCTFENSSARINEAVLAEMNITDGVYFVGDKEIEDSFSNSLIA